MAGNKAGVKETTHMYAITINGITKFTFENKSKAIAKMNELKTNGYLYVAVIERKRRK